MENQRIIYFFILQKKKRNIQLILEISMGKFLVRELKVVTIFVPFPLIKKSILIF